MYLFLSFLSGTASFHIFPFFPLLTAVFFLSLAVILAKRSERKALLSPEARSRPSGRLNIGRFGPALLFATGFLLAMARHDPPEDYAYLSGRELFIQCTVNGGAPRPLTSGKFASPVTLGRVADGKNGRPLTGLTGREMILISDEALTPETRYEIMAKAGQDASRLNPGSTRKEVIYAYLTGIVSAEKTEGDVIRTWLEETRNSLNACIAGHFGPDAGALITSITTGERSAMSEELRDDFGRTGLAHLLSISGTHFGLFSMVIFTVFRLVMNVLPHGCLRRFTLHLTPVQAAALLSIPFMLFYFALSGTSIPAVRSFIMMMIFLLGLLLGRKGAWLNSLLFAAFLICLWEPSAVLDLSFQLSFLAVLFIGLSVGERKEQSRARGLGGRLGNLIRGTFLISLAVSLGTAPLVAYHFHYFSLLSPFSNIVVTPFLGFVVLPLSLFSAFIFIFSGHYPFQPLIAATAEIVLSTVRRLASVPFADVRVPAFPLAALLFLTAGSVVFLSGRRRTALGLLIAGAAIALVPPILRDKGMTVTYLDVGQGDSAVIETADGTLAAIDTGRTGRELDEHLRYLGRRSLDVLVITHADEDHSGGASRILKKFAVNEIWDNGLIIYPFSLPMGSTHRGLARGDELSFPGFRVTVLHPYQGFYTAEGNDATAENNDSLVIKVSGLRTFLFTADCSREAEEDMMHLGNWLKSDVMKVAHHGSRTSTSEDFFRTVSPSASVISAGRYNSYGHPHNETLERLKGSTVYRTDRDGAIKIGETADGLEIRTFRDFRFEEANDLATEWRNLKRVFKRW